MDEQNGGGQQPGAWESWAAAEGQPADSGHPAAIPDQPDAPGQATAFTQPIGFPEGGAAGSGHPGYSAAGSYEPPGDYGQAGGYGPPPSSGYGPPPGSGYGPPPGGGYGGYGMPPYGRPPRRRRGLATVITYLAVAALAATAGGLVVSFADTGSNTPGAGSGNFGIPNNGSGSAPSSGNSGANISSATAQKVRDAVLPGVVVIDGSLSYEGNGAADAGTGMIINKSGLVLTNNHVIEQTTSLTATVVSTGRRYPVKWLGYDKGSDVAVLQLEGASNLTTIPIGDSSTVKVGDGVVAMGNAGGTGSISTVTGTITGVDQSITASDQGSGEAPEKLTDMLQTDANIISGDSGGPLATTAGKVIGMDTAASSSNVATQESVGFAIPIQKALTIADKIIKGQSGDGVQVGSSGFIGVLVAGAANGSQSTQTNPQSQLQQQESEQGQGQFGNPSPQSCVENNAQTVLPTSIAPVSSGTLVLGTLCGTPANQAGIVGGDVITSAAGKQVSSPASLLTILSAVHGGTSVRVTWVTPSDQTVNRTITVAAAPPE